MKDLKIGAAYVGSMGHHWFFDRNLNRPIWSPTATNNNRNDRRPIWPGKIAELSLLETILNNNYHGLQVTAEKRFSHNFRFRGFYTFGKSIDDANLQNDQRGGAQDPKNIKADRARTNVDSRHDFSMGAVWMPNYFTNLPTPVRTALAGWTISAMARARSGRPFTVSTGEDNNYDGADERANLIGSPQLSPNRSRAEVVQEWFNTAAFAPTSRTSGEFGNAGRNILDGPGFKNLDFAIFRDFNLREDLKLQFRFESNNVFNLVNLDSRVADLDSSNYGQILDAGGMCEPGLDRPGRRARFRLPGRPDGGENGYQDLRDQS